MFILSLVCNKTNFQHICEGFQLKRIADISLYINLYVILVISVLVKSIIR